MQNLFKSKIFTKKFLSYLIIMCVTILAIVYVLLNNTRKSLESQQLTMIENYRKDSANLILGWLNGKKHDVKNQAVYLSNLTDQELKSEKITKLIKDQATWKDSFYDILILDENGIVINSASGASKINLSKKKYFVNSISGKTTITGIYESTEKGIPIVAIGEPILKENTPKYVLVGIISLENINNVVRSLEFGGWAHAYLVDDKNALISNNSDNMSKHTRNNSILNDDNVSLKAIEDIKDKKISSEMYVDSDRNSVFCTYQWINELQVGLVIEIKGSYLLEPINKLIMVIIALSAIVILASIVLAFGVNINIVKPINEIIVNTENIIEGDYKSSINIKTKSELDDLAASFNKMQRAIEIREIELQKKNEALKEQTQQAIESSRLKSEFLANMSHELRTPLNSIIGFTTRVIKKSKGLLPEQQLENLNIVKEQAYHLLYLINDLLDFSKIEAGKMEVYNEEFRLEEVIEETSNMIKVLIEGKPIKYKVKFNSNYPINMYSDRLKVKQILINLLSNSIKYSETGTIELKVEKINDRCKISIKDEGIGIAEENLKIIFEEFRQIDGSYTRKIGGTGLGLSITKKFVEMLGGSIDAESKLGLGSCFTITLPINNMQPKTIEESELHINNKIICIDDDTNILKLYKEYLNDNNFNVLCLNGTEDVVRIITEAKPDLVILDIIMPNKDGWEILSEMKTSTAAKNIPVIMVSVLNEKSLAYKMYADEYLVKPITQEELLSAVKKVLSRTKEIKI
ncbi:ATP-binding protein [Clostridium omnivorum]|uniref:Stage 0 sporulation protein A homolog n=1 Tax=Clostridium omnivorum TaxID=1604902 RepID=A0ABQ5N8N8_9CLOT|nr:ATP-binding protein [Clostridium sp. E14]GLC31491.1 hypothetical protein bsdE14_29010 [Clostridium sp. E14]